MTDQAAPAVEQTPEDAIMALLDKEVPEEPKEQAPETEQKESETAEEAQPETEAETAEEDTRAAIEIDPDEALFEVPLKSNDGKPTKLSLKELQQGYMRQDDYTRKTQEVARQRDEVPEKIRQGIQEQLTKSVEQIEALQATLLHAVAPELRGVDFNKLATEDPAEYVRVSNRARQVEQAWKTMEAEKQRHMTELTERQKQALERTRNEAIDKLRMTIPNWDEVEKPVREFAVKQLGFTEAELDSVHHPSFYRALHDAHEFHKSKSTAKQIVDKKVALKPKVMKPGTVKDDPSRERVTESFKKLQRSHSIDDAAEAIFHSLK